MSRTYILTQQELDHRLMLARCETLRLAIRRFKHRIKHGEYPAEKRSKMGRELEDLIEREWRRMQKRIDAALGSKRPALTKIRSKLVTHREKRDTRKRRYG